MPADLKDSLREGATGRVGSAGDHKDVTGVGVPPTAPNVTHMIRYRGTEELPTWRGRLHAIAAVLCVPACLTLISHAVTLVAALVVAVYSIGLVGMFTVSALYHHMTRDEARARWRKADHSMIFVLIAATYTPICLLGMPARWGVPLVVSIWVGALAGIASKIISFDRLGKRLGNFLYPGLGWTAVIGVPVFAAQAGTMPALLLAAGGIVFTGGAAVLARHRPDPLPKIFGYHEVWHVATIVGCACHFAVVGLLVTTPLG